MAIRSDLEAAASIISTGCEVCPCGNIHVRLHDRGGDIFAVGSMPLSTAERFVEQLQQHVAAAKKQGLSAIRCEGSA